MSRARALLIVVALCGTGAPGAAAAAVFVVANTNDSGPGSLRQAILDSNRAPGADVIEIDLPGGGSPNVISPTGRSLPPIAGPVIVRIKGTEPVPPPPPAPAGRGGRGRGAPADAAPPPPPPPAAIVILDGSKLVDACPRESVTGAGLTVEDSANVEIYGFEIRNFCVGIAVVRSRDVILHDLTIGDSRGAAGVVFTGGTHDSLLQGSTIGLTRPAAGNGNAVRFAGGDRNALMGNTFTNYVDTAVVIAGDGLTIRDNRFVANDGAGLRASGPNLLIIGNTFSNNGGDAMTVSGAGSRVMDNLVSGNRGKGIVAGGAGVTLSRNSISGSALPAIDAAAGPGVPVIEPASKWSAEGVTINGSLAGKPGERYAVEIFLSRAPEQAQVYIGTASATPNASGKATFNLTIRIPDLLGEGQTSGFVTATARDAAGSTSRLSRSLSLGKS